MVVSAPLSVTKNTTAVTVIGFEATIKDFVTLKGDFGFAKVGTDISVVVQNGSATLSAVGFTVGVNSAKMGLLVKAMAASPFRPQAIRRSLCSGSL